MSVIAFHEPREDNPYVCKHCTLTSQQAFAPGGWGLRCLVRQPLTHTERQELIHRPFMITYIGVSYPWSGTIVTNQFRRSVEDLLEDMEAREMHREMRLALLQTDEARFAELALRDVEERELSASSTDSAVAPAPDRDPDTGIPFTVIRQTVAEMAAQFCSDIEIASALGVSLQRVRATRYNLGV